MLSVDKAIFGKVVRLEKLGYYTLATLEASPIPILAGPIFSVSLPRLSALAARDVIWDFAKFYHAASLLVALVMLPLVVVIGMDSSEALLIWTGNSSIADRSGILVTILTIGTKWFSDYIPTLPSPPTGGTSWLFP